VSSPAAYDDIATIRRIVSDGVIDVGVSPAPQQASARGRNELCRRARDVRLLLLL